MTDLTGATSPGGWGAYPATPGEFAARWNGMAFEARRDLVALITENARAVHACWAAAHVPGGVAARRVERAWATGRVAGLGEAAAALERAGLVEAALWVEGLAERGA